MKYSITYHSYYVLGIIHEYRFPPLYQPTPWESHDEKEPCYASPYRPKTNLYQITEHVGFINLAFVDALA